MSCETPELRPRELRLFINRTTAVGFEDDEIPTQQIVLSEGSYDSKGIAVAELRFVKFQRVKSLSVPCPKLSTYILTIRSS